MPACPCCIQVCYRRNGHNEMDEPMFTQPLMYKQIRKQKPVLQKYAELLVSQGVVNQPEYEVRLRLGRGRERPGGDRALTPSSPAANRHNEAVLRAKMVTQQASRGLQSGGARGGPVWSAPRQLCSARPSRRRSPNTIRSVRRPSPDPRTRRSCTSSTGWTPPGPVSKGRHLCPSPPPPPHSLGGPAWFLEEWCCMSAHPPALGFFTLDGQPRSMTCPSTGLTEDILTHIGNVASSVPVENFTIHGGEDTH